MIHLRAALDAWNTPAFNSVLKREILQSGSGRLPLQQGLSSSSHALDDTVELMIIATSCEPQFIRARVGIFFSGVVAGCNCADDPTPVEPQNEYCEALIAIDRTTAETSITLIED